MAGQYRRQCRAGAGPGWTGRAARPAAGRLFPGPDRLHPAHEERGDSAAADHAGRLAQLVQRISQQHRGKPVKWLGDGVMFYFREAGEAALAALEMVEGVARAGLPPAHVGLHAGPVVFQAGDYFGRTVNIAARISDYARPGEVLLTQETVDLSRSPEVTFTDLGQIDLKGIAEPLHLHAAHRTV